MSPDLTLVGELGGSDVQLLALLFKFRELSLQLGLVQLGIVQLGLYVLMVQLEILVILQQLTIRRVQSEGWSRVCVGGGQSLVCTMSRIQTHF